jgi:cytochrome P450
MNSAAISSHLPPGPKSPAASQLVRYTLWPGPFLESCAREFGDPFTIKLAGYGSFVMLSSPDAVKDVFRGDPHVLHSGEANEFFSVTVGRNSVLVLDEGPHQRQRRVLVPPLQGERMRGYHDVMREATESEIARWPVGSPFPIEHSMREITLAVILRAVLGLPPGEELSEFGRRVSKLLEFAGTRYALILVPLMPHWLLKKSRWMPFYKHLLAVDEMLYAIIRRRRAAGSVERTDVLQGLLDSRHEDGAMLSEEEIRDAVITMLVAGHETSTISLAWIFEQVLTHPEVIEKLKSELAAVVGSSDVEAEHLPKLEYLDAVVREALRVRTIVPFVTRLVKEPFTAGGRKYPAGTHLSPCIHLVHRRPDIYPDPERFRPERFLERRFSPYEWLPFGGGNRLCVGMAFAMYEMKVIVAVILSKLNLERPAGSVSKFVRRGILVAPADGMRVTLRSRD